MNIRQVCSKTDSGAVVTPSRAWAPAPHGLMCQDNAMSTPAIDKMVFRKTNQHLGRRISVTPANSTNRHLSYGRIRLDESKPAVAFNSDGQETALICLSGKATVRVSSKTSRPPQPESSQFDLAQYDSIYIPRDSEIEVTTGSEVDFADFSADVDGVYPW